MHSVEYADFSDLIKVVTKDENKKIWSQFGFDKEAWETEAATLVGLRHKIMHPVKTLVARDTDVKVLAGCNDFMKKLVDVLFAITSR